MRSDMSDASEKTLEEEEEEEEAEIYAASSSNKNWFMWFLAVRISLYAITLL